MINQISSTISQHFNPQRIQPELRTADNAVKPASTSLSNEASQRILNDKIIDALDKVLQKDQVASVRTLRPEDFTPQAVSERILSFVKDAINRAEARGSNVRELFEKASQGVDQGFRDAQNILTSLNALSDKIAEGVQQTYEMIQNGMQKIADAMQNSNAQRAVVQQAVAGFQAMHSRSVEVNIVTKDGDELTLSLKRNSASGSYEAVIKRPNAEVYASEQRFEFSENFSMQIQGNLDDGEIEAIQNLLGNIDKVSAQFFNGDVNGAFEAGMGLGFDASELASFSLNLNQNQSLFASRAYREVSGFSDDHHQLTQAPAQLDQLLNPIRGFMKGMESTIFSAQNGGMFEDAKSAVEEIFNFLSTSKPEHSNALERLQDLSGKSFDTLSKNLLSQLTL